MRKTILAAALALAFPAAFAQTDASKASDCFISNILKLQAQTY